MTKCDACPERNEYNRVLKENRLLRAQLAQLKARVKALAKVAKAAAAYRACALTEHAPSQRERDYQMRTFAAMETALDHIEAILRKGEGNDE